MEKTIDIEKVFRNKLGSITSFLPLKWFEKLVHLDEINEFLWENRDKYGVDFTDAVLKRLNVKIEVEGMENLPAPDDPKRLTFVSNHALGAIDGVSIMSTLGHYYGSSERFGVISNDILTLLPGIAPLLIPINQSGKQSRDLPAQMNAAFGSDKQVVLFPAGIVSRKKNGVLHDLKWNKMFVGKTTKYQRDVLPIHFIGENSPFYYRVTRYFDWFLTKKGAGRLFNFLFMPGEMIKTQNKTFRIKFGKPIPWQTFDKSKTPDEWAQYVSDIVHSI